jgi:hypothetical protein
VRRVAELLSFDGITRMKRFLPHLLWASGLLLLFKVFVLGPAAVYQKTTTELDLLEEQQSEGYVMLGLAGLLLLAVGGLWVITRWFSQRSFRRTVT